MVDSAEPEPSKADTVDATYSAPVGVEEGAVLEDRYTLRAPLGRGGMSEVWRAHDRRLDREVAVKLLGESTKEPKFAERLAREATTIAKLRHPNIVEVYDAGTDGAGRPFLVMELLQGEPLAKRVPRGVGLGAADAIRALLPIGDALVFAHSQNVIHRDLKPANVYFTRTARGEMPKLLDFGIARLMDPEGDVTAGWVGTPEFMAPEQLDLGRRLTPAVDQWAFAIVLYEVATGRPPFRGEDMGTLFEAIRDAALPFPRTGGVDGRLFRILARATRKKPEERYDSLRDMLAELEGWLGTRDSRRPSTIPPVAPSPIPEALDAPLGNLDDAIRDAFGDGT